MRVAEQDTVQRSLGHGSAGLHRKTTWGIGRTRGVFYAAANEQCVTWTTPGPVRGRIQALSPIRARSNRRRPRGGPSAGELAPIPSPSRFDESLEPIDQESSFEKRSSLGDWSKSKPESDCACAGANGGARGGSARHSRIRRATTGSVMAASSLIRPPQAGQRSASTSKTRFSSSAHAMRRESDSLRSARKSIHLARTQHRLQRFRSCRDHLVACARTRCEHPVIADLIRPRRRDQRSQPLEQLASLHHDMRRAVSPLGLQAIGEPTVRHRLEATQGKWRARVIRRDQIQTAKPALTRLSRHGTSGDSCKGFHAGTRTIRGRASYPDCRATDGTKMRTRARFEHAFFPRLDRREQRQRRPPSAVRPRGGKRVPRRRARAPPSGG